MKCDRCEKEIEEDEAMEHELSNEGMFNVDMTIVSIAHEGDPPRCKLCYMKDIGRLLDQMVAAVTSEIDMIEMDLEEDS